MGGTIEMGTCPRCRIGIDSNGDGDCAFCIRKADSALLPFMAETIRALREQIKSIDKEKA